MKTKNNRFQDNPNRATTQLTLMDNEFMTACFDGNIPAAQLLVRIILEKDDLIVTDVHTEEEITKEYIRVYFLQIHAADSEGKEYGIEVYRDDLRTNPLWAEERKKALKRAYGKSAGDPEKPLDSYLIRLCECDYSGRNRPIYHTRWTMDGEEMPDLFPSEIVLNMSRRDGTTDLGKLKEDFFCTDPEKMHFPVLADAVRRMREKKEGSDVAER